MLPSQIAPQKQIWPRQVEKLRLGKLNKSTEIHYLSKVLYTTYNRLFFVPILNNLTSSIFF